MDGQVYVPENIPLRARIVEGHVLQPQLIPVGCGRLHSALKPKRLRNVQIFLYFGQVDALLMQLAALGQDAGHPRCSAADGGKVEQKCRCRPAMYQSLPNQIRIRDAVAKKRQRHVSHISPEISPFPAGDEGGECLHGFFPQFPQPRG